jgi:hypothetical protein
MCCVAVLLINLAIRKIFRIKYSEAITYELFSISLFLPS